MNEAELLSRIRFPSTADQLQMIRNEVRKVLEDQGCDIDTIGKIVLGVNEACMNIIQHAYGEDHPGDIILEIFEYSDELIFRLTDFADAVDTNSIHGRDLGDIRPGGLGIHIINEVMDTTAFLNHPEGVGNILEMRKKIKL